MASGMESGINAYPEQRPTSPRACMNAMKWARLHPLLLLALAACATVHAPAGTTFVAVRHAEKASDGTRDPPLIEAGRARAQALSQRLAGTTLVAAYATTFRRTQQTAQPAAAMHGIAVTTYDAATPAADLAARLRAQHDRGMVLVVGHSNTVPSIVAALCACTVAELGEDDYDRIYTVRVGDDGRAALEEDRPSQPSTATSP